jgi:endoglucanase
VAIAARFAAGAAAACIGFGAQASWAADSDVRLNSIGYAPNLRKRATITAPATTFVVHRTADGSVASSGMVTGPSIDADTQSPVYGADFSTVTEEGQFYVEVPGVGRSVDFPIASDAYRDALTGVLTGFYGWRCGTAVSFNWSGTTYSHGPCHTADAKLDPIASDVGAVVGSTHDGTKGWHDAGDYGKYVVNGAFAVGMLLRAWEQHSAALGTLKLPIPETGGALPDYLAEVRWELEWLLTMQYSASDGRVSHKLTSRMFDVFEMPEVDALDRFFVPFGSAATADFAAAMAQAARVYGMYDSAFAGRCLQAAQLSQAWLRANPTNVAANQTGFSTGGYATTDPDDRYWAAAEMWATTGDAAALADFETRANNYRNGRTGAVDVDFDWGNVRNLGTLTYVLSPQAGADPAVKGALTTAMTGAAGQLVAAASASAWGRAVGYYWGANGSVARSCMLLDAANIVAPSASYLGACADQIANLFGRNQYGRSQVTGFGLAPPLHPHHRPSASDGIVAPWPGLLVGGAQIGATTDVNIVTFADGGTSMPKSWVDEQARYWVNEVAINWNAALAYALAAFLSDSPSPTGTGPGNPGADGGRATIGGGSDAGPDAPGPDAGPGATASEGDAGGAPSRARSRGRCACRAGRAVNPGDMEGRSLSWASVWLAIASAFAARRRRRAHNLKASHPRLID